MKSQQTVGNWNANGNHGAVRLSLSLALVLLLLGLGFAHPAMAQAPAPAAPPPTPGRAQAPTQAEAQPAAPAPAPAPTPAPAPAASIPAPAQAQAQTQSSNPAAPTTVVAQPQASVPPNALILTNPNPPAQKSISPFLRRRAAPSTAAGSPPAAGGWNFSQIATVVVALVLIVMIVRLAYPLFARLAKKIDEETPKPNLSGLVPAPAGNAWPNTLAEQDDLSRFQNELHAGPSAPAADKQPAEEKPASDPIPLVPQPYVESASEQPKAETDPVQRFFAWAPAHVATMQSTCEKISRAKHRLTPRDLLGDLYMQAETLKNKSSRPELLPIWQMTGAVEGLLKQVTERMREFTPSTLRTIESAINLLNDLCQPGLRTDLLTEPPIRLLAVDDDAVSRYAITQALKRGFAQPDLAETGEAALALAMKNRYDGIFLDVRMPGMDGFELCSRLRKSGPNQTTPVVFITVLQDFEARANSIVSGGNDLIGKPFLAFEVVVKAFTFILRDRLAAARSATVPTSDTAIHLPPVQLKGQASAPAASKAKSSPGHDTQMVARPRETHAPAPIPMPPTFPVPDATPSVPAPALVSPELPRPAVLAGIRAEALPILSDLHLQLLSLEQAADEPARWKSLAAIYLALQALTQKLDHPELRPAFQLSTALEALFKKLHEAPKNVTASTLRTAAVGLELLRDLCAAETNPEFASNPAISILVVDDDAVTRRAVTSALQTVFLKPDNAADAESALAIAAEKVFDVLFLDIKMPGMDGFAACAKIRESGPNQTTPVIFVTSSNDDQSREQAKAVGGDDYVTKPFLFVELTVKALSFALRGRLNKAQSIQGH